MDIVIVLGAQNQADGTLSPMALARAEGGFAEYRRHPGAMMLVTGGYGHFNYADRPHAHFVADYLMSMGLRRQDLLPLAISANSVEDAVIVRSIVHGMQVTSLRVVTSEHHLPRAQAIFEHFYPTAQLTMVAVPMAVAADEIERHMDHELMAAEQIRRQGGVFVGETLIESYETCPCTSELIELLILQNRTVDSLVSTYPREVGSDLADHNRRVQELPEEIRLDI